MEKNMETTIMANIGVTIRSHSFIPNYPMERLSIEGTWEVWVDLRVPTLVLKPEPQKCLNH